MRKFIVTLFLLYFILPSYADINKSTIKKYNNMPQGTFKKQRNGVIAQYDKTGKIIGKYKADNGRYYRIK